VSPDDVPTGAAGPGDADRQTAATEEWRLRWEGTDGPTVTADGGQPAPAAHGPGDLPALTVSEVAVRFGGVAALSDVSLTAWPGRVTGLIGPNGAGKTTLFNVISGLQDPDRGTIRFYDTDVTGMKPHRRARLGLARTFQRLELFGTLSAGENVQVGLESAVKWWQWRHVRRSFPWRRGPLSAGGDSPEIDDPGGPGSLAVTTSDRILAGVGLEGLSHEQASALPTGLARMVELGRGLALGPKLLLLDEPGSGLDEAESEALGDLLLRLAGSGMAVLLVEHDMELVMRICDTIHVLDFGQIIASGTPGEIRADEAVQAAYLGVSHAEGDPDHHEVHARVAEVHEKLAALHDQVGALHEQVAQHVDEPPPLPPRPDLPGGAPS
jgi:branched-chain amino acid transport system ATP-binding protein